MPVKDTSASQFPQVSIVEASAGSGKTYCLARRYIQLLINPSLKDNEIPLDTILAITFTNKAALEMKERILDFLKRIAFDKFPDPAEKSAFFSSLGVSPEKASDKAYKIMDALLKNYNFFQVQTIDSFINAILCGCAFKLGLSANFKTQKEYFEYLEYALDNLIDRADSDRQIKDLFYGFLRQHTYIENRANWFPKQDILLMLANLFSKSNRYSGIFMPSRVNVGDLIKLKKDILTLMRRLQDGLPEGTHQGFLKNLSEFISRNSETFDIDKIPGRFKNEELPLNKNARPAERMQGVWDKIRQALAKLCEVESAVVYNYYIDIFNLALADLNALSAKEDILFLETLNKKAAGLFDREALSLPELYYRLATRFRHFLIDEFQDTSRLQWENIFLMVEEALSSAGSLFYVGDRKQAIYRFRGGEVSLIDSVRERFSGYNLREEVLTTNFRSSKEIVDFNNKVFSGDNLSRFLKDFTPAESSEIISIFKEAVQSHNRINSGGYVEIEALDYKNKQERDELVKEKLFGLLGELRQRYSLKDIAILVRKNSEAELVSGWLLQEAIPVESELTLNIKQNPYIKELVSFLKFLNSPIDNLSFASFLLGEIFCSASGLKQEQLRDFIFQARNKDEAKAAYLYRAFRLEFGGIWDELIEEFFKNVGFLPLYELVLTIFSKFEVLDRFSGYQAFFMRFLELIKEQEEKASDISSFLEFFDNARDEDLYVKITESNAVRVLTIHKSKGLEFPVVIVPFLEIDARPGFNVVLDSGSGLNLLYLKKVYGEFSVPLREIYREEYFRSFVDELNSIYVAFTRPKDELYIFSDADTLPMPEGETKFGAKASVEKEGLKNHGPILQLACSRYRDWIRLLKDEFSGAGILESRAALLRGEALHYILSLIGNLYDQDKKIILEAALNKAQARFPFVPGFQEFKDIAANILKDNKLKVFFEDKDAQIFPEKEIVDSGGNTKRIDRLILKEKEALIIDYKSSRDNQEEHRLQVKEYMRLISEIFPRRKLRGVLLYLDDLSIEEV